MTGKILLPSPNEMKDYEILSEDFSKVTSKATKDSPESAGNKSKLTTLDDYTQLGGWYGQGNMLANGMLGCRQGTEANYEVITPELPLGNGDKSYKVAVSVYFIDADTLMIQGNGKADMRIIPGKAGETVNATVSVGHGYDGLRVWFYTKHYGAFMLDDVKITQTLAKGDQVGT